MMAMPVLHEGFDGDAAWWVFGEDGVEVASEI